MNIVYNIGLNNNRMTADEILEFMSGMLSGFFGEVLEYSEIDGMWNGENEPTLVVNTRTDKCSSREKMYHYVSRMADMLDQDCIAIKINGEGVMVYSSTHSGVEQKFNNKYFLEI